MTHLTAARLLDLDARLSMREREITQAVARLRLVSGRQLERLYFHGGNNPEGNARLGTQVAGSAGRAAGIESP